ncbi:MAG TPA: hypothetical protein VM141_07620 [Planctomycetota bacterium]|nr:hypothetical protein [Planctomycetota bacterium]
MTLTPLTERSEIETAFRDMTERLKSGTQAFDRKIGYHSGCVEHTVYWHSGHGFWWLFDPKHAKTKNWCCYGTDDPENQNMLSITVETNTPYEGVNRSIGGVFVRDDNGCVYLAHLGNVGGGRPGIGKQAFWESESYDIDLVQTVRWPDRRESRVIVVGPVDSDHLPADIALFVREVAKFKADATSGRTVVHRERLRRIFMPEFEGPRRGYTPPSEIEAWCDHGVVVNRLHEALTEAGHNSVNDRRDLYILAGDDVTHLFEVKTDLSSTSVYQGVGQLMLHGAVQAPAPRRIFVVPGLPNRATRQALKRLGISVLIFEWEDGDVVFPGLEHVLG